MSASQPCLDGETAAEQVLAYHARTRHALGRYAAGPETLDWSAQPDPFREFCGAPRIDLPLGARRLAVRFADLYRADTVPVQALCLDTVAMLMELSLAISAWKVFGPDRWAVRCNPSSGNLHPTEAYLICRNVPGLADGVYHYLARSHSLEQRCRYPRALPGQAELRVGLSSIAWREAWKYGERAFRYCQLDTGHALGALRYAAACLGWTLTLDADCGSAQLTHWLGLDREADYRGAEREHAELLLGVAAGGARAATLSSHASDDPNAWFGQANLLDPQPMYRWPVIDEVARASRKPPTAPVVDVGPIPTYAPRIGGSDAGAVDLILSRRSAQRFDGAGIQSRESFFCMLDALLPRRTTPWDVWHHEAHVHPVLFVHRVDGLTPGLYVLPRSTSAGDSLRAAMRPEFRWAPVPGCPGHLPLFLLAEAHAGKVARMISCHQAIAADCTFAAALLADFDDVVQSAPWRYRQLHWEAGLLGQVLYLEAEAAGLRGTGIGCFFDDACHELLGLSGFGFRSLYHFTVGLPLVDERILSLPPYPALESA